MEAGSKKFNQGKFQSHFSDELVFDFIAFFRERGGEEVSHEMAEWHLDALAGFYSRLTESIRHGFGGGLREGEVPAPKAGNPPEPLT